MAMCCTVVALTLPCILNLDSQAFDIEWPRDPVEKGRALSGSRRNMVRRDKAIKLALMSAIFASEAVSMFLTSL